MDAVDHISEGPPDDQTQAPGQQPPVGAPEPPGEGRDRDERKDDQDDGSGQAAGLEKPIGNAAIPDHDEVEEGGDLDPGEGSAGALEARSRRA